MGLVDPVDAWFMQPPERRLAISDLRVQGSGWPHGLCVEWEFKGPRVEAQGLVVGPGFARRSSGFEAFYMDSRDWVLLDGRGRMPTVGAWLVARTAWSGAGCTSMGLREKLGETAIRVQECFGDRGCRTSLVDEGLLDGMTTETQYS